MIIVHIVPKDVVGGVETAAKSFVGADANGEHSVLVYFIAGQNQSLFNPLHHVKAFRFLMQVKPNVVVMSLWWSFFSTCMFRIVSKGKFVLFLHSQKRAHKLDSFFTSLQSKFADCFFCDSRATEKANGNFIKSKEAYVISLILNSRAKPVRREFYNNPKFIFWGRLARVKRLDKALIFFENIISELPDSQFLVCGPDFGEKTWLESYIYSNSLQHNVKLIGQLQHCEIKSKADQCDFYLQFSDYEGMAMSVIEAMQMGLVPIVSPVGEIHNYCTDDENAVLTACPETAAKRFLTIWKDKQKLCRMRENATKTWEGSSCYIDDFIYNVEKVVE